MTRRLEERGLGTARQGSIYPAVARLARSGLLESFAQAGNGGPPRKFGTKGTETPVVASPAACCLADQTRATTTTFTSAAMHAGLGEDLRVALVRYRDQAIAGRRCPEAAAVVIRAELPLEPVEFLHLLT